MSHNITIEGGKTVRLPTAGKYCDRDIVITAKGGAESELLIQGKLTEWDIPDGVESIANYAFYNNTGLTRVSVPDSVTSIGRNAFYGASNVVSLTLGNGLTELPQDGFGMMRKLVNLKLPDKLISIGNYAFRSANLSEIYFPETFETVGDNVFWECRSLIFVHFGANIKTLGSGSFNSCSKLKTVVIHAPSTVCTLKNINAFTSTPIASGTGFIYVHDNLVEQYKTETNWSTYASQIRAIEDYPDITGG